MTEARNTHGIWPYVALLTGILCVSWSAIFVRWTDMPGAASAFYRMLIPAIILLPTWWLDRKTPRVSWQTLATIAVGGLFFSLDLGFYNTAILHTTAANATLFGNNTPIFVGLFSWIFFRQGPRPAYWLGLLLAGTGSVIVVWHDAGHHMSLGAGDLMALAAAAFFGVYLMATERVRTNTTTLSFLRLAIVSSTLFLLIFNLAAGVSMAVPSRKSWWALLALGLVSQLGGYLALTYALGHLPATITSISLLLQVPITALVAVPLLDEPLSRAQVLGGLFVLAGVGLANRRNRPAEEANATLCEASEPQ